MASKKALWTKSLDEQEIRDELARVGLNDSKYEEGKNEICAG
jgi:hypothetical protein